jgi:ABC-2 type transport system permease protein
MNSLLRAEARKLSSTRSTVALVVAGVLYGLLGVAAAAFAPESERVAIDSDTLLQVVRGVADLAAPVALILGVLATAGEFRHGTIVPTTLVTPRRGRLLTAKVSFSAAVGAALALAGSALAVPAGAAWINSEHGVAQASTGDLALAVVAAAVVAAIYGALGAAVGTIVRNQTAAITGALVWLLVVEEILPVVLRADGLRDWLLDGAATRLLHLPDPAAGAIPLWGAVLVLGAALVTFVSTAAARAVRDDIT